MAVQVVDGECPTSPLSPPAVDRGSEEERLLSKLLQQNKCVVWCV